MAASSNELVLICSEIGTRDYLTSELLNKQFRDVADWLWKKYPDRINDWLRQEMGNMERPTRERAPLFFAYIDEAGNRVPIDHSEDVGKIAQITKQVLWRPQPVGGSNFRQTFGTHAEEILRNPEYKNWFCVVSGSPGYGIRAIGLDPHRMTRAWTIKPTPDYPQSPPIVSSEPPYSDDICWQGGILHYTRYAHKVGSPWKDLARGSTNPLFALIIELLQKYQLSI